MQFLSHEILLVAEFFDPLIAFWVDEKGAHKGAQEVGEARGGSKKWFDENPRCSLSRQTNLLKYTQSSCKKKSLLWKTSLTDRKRRAFLDFPGRCGVCSSRADSSPRMEPPDDSFGFEEWLGTWSWGLFSGPCP